jgi:hypothetical protein
MGQVFRHSLIDTALAVAGLIYLCGTPIWASISLASILHATVVELDLGQRLDWVGWGMAAPLIYVSWLNAFLIGCAIDCQVW